MRRIVEEFEYRHSVWYEVEELHVITEPHPDSEPTQREVWLRVEQRTTSSPLSWDTQAEATEYAAHYARVARRSTRVVEVTP